MSIPLVMPVPGADQVPAIGDPPPVPVKEPEPDRPPDEQPVPNPDENTDPRRHASSYLRDRRYELVSVAGGWEHRTRPRFAETIRASSAPTRRCRGALRVRGDSTDGVGYFQPVTRGELSRIFGKEVSRDMIGNLRGG